MIIQSLISGENTGDLLYARKSGEIKSIEGAMEFTKGAMFETDTYFNSCSVGKWFSYCDIEYIQLEIKYAGDFKLEVIYADYNDSGCTLETLICENLNSSLYGQSDYVYRIAPIYQGVVYYRLTALSDKAKLYNAIYNAISLKSERDITIALNICTYKREQFLMKNIRLLENNYINNNMSPLYGKLKIFVTDNGNTLDCKALSDNNVHVYHNPNVGGAGGFTRGLIEISKYKESDNITNVIFMDDDVKIEPEAIVRTYRLLKLIKEEHVDSFIAGAMLSLNEPYIQYENGALWNMGDCKSVNNGLDIRKFQNVVFNETDSSREYAAWWYCCVNVSVIRDDNLPIPVFIHADDVEYSLRNAKHIITMNGIAIWHPVSENIRLSSNTYYNLRNILIVNTIYCPGFNKGILCRKMLLNFVAACMRYRYRDMRLILMALDDFCKGPEWLVKHDTSDYHKHIQSIGYQLYDVTEQLKTYEVGRNAFYMNTNPTKLKWCRKRILFDRESGKGIELKFSFWQIFSCIAMYLKSLYLIFFKYDKSQKAYVRDYKKLQGIDYWNRVLHL